MSSSDGVPSLPAAHVPSAAELLIITNLLAAAGLDGGLLSKRSAVKTTGTTYAVSSTTMQSDPDLVMSLQANGTYGFEIVYYYVPGTSGSAWKHGVVVPSGASLTWQSINLAPGDFASGITGFTTAGTGTVDRLGRAGSTPTLGTDGTAQGAVLIKGLVVTSTTAGNLQFQGAQAVSNAAAPVVSARSYMTVERFS